MNKNYLLIGASIALMAIMIGISAYYLFFYEAVPVDDLATRICNCAQNQEVLDSKFVLSREDFTYASKVFECFGADFSEYKEGLTDRQKTMYLDLILERVNALCPESTRKLFR